ncbi:MAG TPA: NADH:flavin oxidoreductase [Candidatus Atribacteria bacterium]|nr:NADH:flavin oxidoreductase [Atribacterota bacterium]MDY0135514.1 NADH:flavin oxidoreductase [Atribacterota bacterium]HOQ50993.1 NADH:flavin oxidoreductase [Candidatus Atribacteria bacterium]HPT63601.1 NADH:flavin oxidoreductase [Candidatus Atribacteria bacterium]
MDDNKRFRYSTMDELIADIEKFNLDIPFSHDLAPLREKIELNGKTIGNRLAIHPMEGCDSTPDGAPGELTTRRYMRYTKGKAGLIWFEATAINEKGRANDQQLFLNERTVGDFSLLINRMREEADEGGTPSPYLVLQLSHAGRFGDHKIIAIHDEKLDKLAKVEPSCPVISDRELEELESAYVNVARLAKQAGFDAVDVKSCHRYLLSELLGAREREDKFGGSYENRTRLIKEVVTKIKREVGIEVAIRLNISDFLEYPIGWGVNEKGEVDLSEPLKLVGELRDMGVRLINVTAGSPYINAYISRPADGEARKYTPPEYPLLGVERLIKLSREVQENFKDITVVATGLSWLREFAPYVASGMVEKGYAKIAGFGRMAFAYPDFAKDILHNKGMDKRKVCITCIRCAELKAHRKITGCVIRDSEIYLKPYRDIEKREEE